MSKIHDKVSKAIGQLIFKHPFFSSIFFQQILIEDVNARTYWTDGKRIAYNPNFAELLTVEENVGVLVHEIMHVVLCHHARMGNRDPEIWNEACDYAINPILIEAIDDNGRPFFTLPKGALYDQKYSGWNAEDIYRELMLTPRPKKKKYVVYLSNSGKPYVTDPDGDPSNASASDDSAFGEIHGAENPAQAEEIAKSMVAQAVSLAKTAGKLPEFIARQLTKVEEGRKDWRELFQRWLTEVVAKDYSYKKINKRHIGRGIILPSLYNKAVGNIVMVVDTSGSVGADELTAVINEVRSGLNVLAETKDNPEITIVWVDAIVHGHQVITDDQETIKPIGGGGTDFSQVTPYIEKHGIPVDGMIFITDGYTSHWGTEPSYPCIWMFTNTVKHNPPFGESQHIDIYAT